MARAAPGFTVRMAAVDSAPARFGSYTVYEQLGKGGMATVHRAERAGKGGAVQQVALKRLIPTLQKEIVNPCRPKSKLEL